MMELNKIYNTDCLEGMKELIGPKCIDLILADPPYGIDYQSAWRTDKTKWKPKIKNDKEPFVEWIKECPRILKDTGSIICFYRWDVQENFIKEFKKNNFNITSQIIWDKVIHGMGDLNGSFAPRHENILFVTKNDFTFPNKRPQTVLKYQRVQPEQLIHPNEKPIELINYLIRHLTKPNNTILIPFMGSGVDVISCILNDRNYLAFELDEYYFNLAQKRIKPYLNQTRLNTDGLKKYISD